MATSNNPLSPQESQPKGTSHKKTKHRGFYTYTTVAAIAIIAIGSALYSIKMYIQLHQGVSRQVQELTAKLGTLEQQQLDANALFNSSMNTMNESQQKLQSQLNGVVKNVQSSLQERAYQTKDWLLLKARYYLELAQINAHWSDNWQTTLALLQQTDAILATINDQHLFEVRQTIAKDITQLQSMPKVDIPGLLSQLDAALSMVTNLPLKTTLVPANQPTVKDTNKKETSTWRHRLKESVSLLETLVVVRHQDEDIFPLPSPAYESMLRESVRLYLQEAQWAVLQGNESVYQFSLTQAIKKINYAFTPDGTETIAIQGQLQSLLQIHLIQPQPTLDRSLPLLNQFIESKGTPKIDIKSTNTGVNP